jgi:hypothetical protein
VCMWKQNFFYFQSIIAYARTKFKFSKNWKIDSVFLPPSTNI